MNPWEPAKVTDPALWRMFRRHYSCTNPNTRRVSPGGCKIIGLLSGYNLFEAEAGFVWAFQKFGPMANMAYCMFFRYEGGVYGRASELLLAAEDWIPDDLRPIEAITYVKPSAVNGDGLCFKRAGWTKQKERTKTRNLVVYRKKILTRENARYGKSHNG